MKAYNVLFRAFVIAVVLFKSGLEAATKTIIQSRKTTATLSCPTTDSTIVWYGPPNLMVYANSQGVNTNLAKHHRVSITLDRQLLVQNVSQDDEGFYRCVYVEDGFVKDTNFQLIIARKPTILSTRHRIQTEKGAITNITVNIDAIPAPTISWLTSPRGKVGAWHVTDTGNGTFLLASTIFLYQDDHFGLYTALIRNSEGSVEVQFNLHGYEPVIIVDAASKFCNTSNSITITCSINDTLQRSWNSTWYHLRNGFPIRAISGSYDTDSTMLRIPYCDYQDQGIYTCKWTNGTSVFSSSISLIVKSVPTVTTRIVTDSNDGFIFSIKFYSNTPPLHVLWYLDDELIENTTMASLKRTNVTLSCYGINVQDIGYEAVYKSMMVYNARDVHCLIRNEHGYTESRIPFDNAIIKDITTNDIVSSRIFHQDNKPENAEDAEYMEMYRFIAIGTGVFLIILFTVSLIIWKWKQKGNTVEINNARRHIERPDDNESTYEEIGNINEEPNPDLQDELLSNNPVYLDVIPDEANANETTEGSNVDDYLKPGTYRTEVNQYKSLTGIATAVDWKNKRDTPVSATVCLRKTI